MVAKLFSSQNKSSSDERDSLTPCNIALDSVQYEKNIARLLQCKVNWDLFRYIIITYTPDYLKIISTEELQWLEH